MKYSIFLSAILITWVGMAAVLPAQLWKKPALLPATAACQDIVLDLDMNGQVVLTPADIDNGSTGSGMLSFSLSDSIFYCGDIGVQQVVLIVSDTVSRDSCTANVTIVDPVLPVAKCKNIIVQLDANGEVVIAPSDVDGGSSDACGIMQMSLNNDDFSCTDVSPFSKIVSLTVMDSSQNLESCQALVKVEDKLPPDIRCQNLTLELDAFGGAKIDVADVSLGASDNCGISSLIIDRDSFSCADISQFNKIINLQATDIHGNDSSCQALIMVIDNKAPEAICKDIYVYLDSLGSYMLSPQEIDDGSSDNCGISAISISASLYSCTSIGTSQIASLRVEDNYGNRDSCDAQVTVRDTLAPGAVCQDISVFLDANGSYSLAASEIEGGSTDNCEIDEIRIPITQFDCAATASPAAVVLAILDESENKDSCTALVTVRDSLPPDAQCQDLTVYLDASGSYTLTAAELDDGSTDNCGIAAISIPPSSFDCSSGPAAVQLTVTDVHANTADCSAQITVQDTLKPTANCQPLTVYLDAAGTFSLAPSVLNNNSMDNCGASPLSLSINQSNFDCSHVGVNLIDLSVTDASNNSASCQAMVTVADSTSPDAICQNLTLQLDVMGNATLFASDVDNGSDDACGIQTLDINKNTFDCTDLLNSMQTLAVTVTDVNNNTSSCQAVVTIQDTIGPVVSCTNVTVFLDSMGQAGIAVNDVGSASDNCLIKGQAIDRASFNCSHLGMNTILYAAEDSSGNRSSCNPQVEVRDTLSPIISCPNAEFVPANESCQAILTDFTGKVSPTDNCASQPAVTQMPPANTVVADTTLITLTARDGSNNASSCSFHFIVVDESPPEVSCKNIVVKLDSSGQATITPDDVTDMKMDNCTDIGNLISRLDRNVLDCSDVDANPSILLTVFDENDNVDSCVASIRVDDDIAPLVTCADTMEVELGDVAQVMANVTMTDNCAVRDVNFNLSQFSCFQVAGYVPVEIRVEDPSNNVTPCTTYAYVKDTAIAAWLSRPPDIIRCGEQLIDWNEPTARFPCERSPLVSYTSQPAGLVKEGIFPVGITQIFYELEDALVRDTLKDDFQIEILPIPIIENYSSGDEFVANTLEEFEIFPQADVEGVSFIWELQLSEFLEVTPALPVGQTPGPIVQTFSFTDPRSVGEARYRITPVFADSCVGASVEILIRVRPGTGTFFVPEMFTPNGDGFNDDWGAQLLKAGNPDDYRITVFNQAGGKMFSAISLSNRWNGGNCPDGPYWYIIERKDTGERVKTGGVTIQR